MSFVTGLGERYPRNPTCEVCLADDVDEPYPGLPIFGVFAHLSNGHPFYKIANHDANNFPYIMYASEDRPVLTRYIDHKQIIPQSEYTISTMSHTLVAVGLLAKRLNRLHVQNATLVLDDGSPWGSVELGLSQHYILPTASCTWLFDEASLGALGGGANCSSDGQVSHGEGLWRLLVRLGSGSSVAAGVALTTRGPEVGYSNYETRQWQQTVVVTLSADGGRRLMAASEGGGAKAAAPCSRRRMQTDTEASAAADEAVNSFGAIAGAEQAYDSGVMLTVNSSAPESSVSPFGAVGFDALAAGEARSSMGTQVDFSRGSAPDGGLFACPGDCSGNGACLADIGECVCLLGASGDACEIGHLPPSNSPSAPVFLVTSSFTAPGDVSDYSAAELLAVRAIFAAAAGNLPLSAVELVVSSGSVMMTVTVSAESASAANSALSNLNGGIMADASTLNAALATGGVSITVLSVTAAEIVELPTAPTSPLPTPPSTPERCGLVPNQASQACTCRYARNDGRSLLALHLGWLTGDPLVELVCGPT